jgi:hypothetical protein
MFKIGEHVEVVDGGYLYSTWDAFFGKHNLCISDWENRRELDVSRRRGNDFVVLFSAPHGIYDSTLVYLIQDGNRQTYIIGERGMKSKKTKEMTVEQISKELGYDVKVVKG